MIPLDRCGEAAAFVAFEVDLPHVDLGTGDRRGDRVVDVVIEGLTERLST